MPRLLDDLGDRRLMLGDGLLQGEPHMKHKRRAEYRQRADGVEAARRKRREALALYRTVADEEVGVPRLPDGAGGVELYVAANGPQLARVKRQLDVAIAGEDNGTDGGSHPRTPAPLAKFEPPLDPQLAGRSLASGGSGLAQKLCHKLDPPLGKGLVAALGNIVTRVQGATIARAAGVAGVRGVPGVRGEAPSVPLLHERLRPFNRVGETVGDEERRDVAVAIVVGDEKKVNVVGHHHEIAYRDSGPHAMNGPQRGNDDLAQWQKVGPPGAPCLANPPARLQRGKARQRLPPLGHNQRHKEELPSPLGIFKFHQQNYTKICTGIRVPTLPFTASPLPHSSHLPPIFIATQPVTNTVGYLSKDMPTAGYYNYTPMFVGVGGTDPAVKDIKPSSTATSDLSGGVINLFVLDTGRKFAKTFSWFTEDDLYDEDGWYYGSEETVTDYTLGAGESRQVKAPYQVTFTYSGEVDQGAYDFTAPAAGYYMVGNQHATPMSIKDIVPSSTETSDLSGGVINLFVLDTERKFAKTFSWFTEDDLYDENGWYYGSEETVTDYALAPGEVLQFKAPYQVKLSFPAQ